MCETSDLVWKTCSMRFRPEQLRMLDELCFRHKVRTRSRMMRLLIERSFGEQEEQGGREEAGGNEGEFEDAD